MQQIDARLFPDFPDDARIWIYAAHRDIEGADAHALLEGLAPFLESWTSHRRQVRGDAAVVQGRFLVLSATASDGNLSGCGIDKSVHRIEELGRELDIEWSSSLDVAWVDTTGSVRLDPRSEFRRKARDGAVDSDTTVFDLSIGTLGLLRAGRFRLPASQSWHARVFGLETPTT